MMHDPNAYVPALVERAHFSTTFGRRPRMIRVVRHFVSQFHDEIVLGAELPQVVSSARASQLAMAAHEMVENALAYGPGGQTSFSITIDPDPDDPVSMYAVCIKTRNRAAPRDQQIVREMLSRLAAADDPQQVYVELMTETARRRQGSGLGLARIRVEADMDITCVVDGEELEIVAQIQFPHAPAGDRSSDAAVSRTGS